MYIISQKDLRKKKKKEGTIMRWQDGNAKKKQNTEKGEREREGCECGGCGGEKEKRKHTEDTETQEGWERKKNQQKVTVGITLTF